MERVGHFVGIGPQRVLTFLIGVVGILRCHVAHRSLGLDPDEVLIVLHIEYRLSRVDDPPHDDRCHLDGIPVGIVHLEDLAVEVPNTEADLLPVGEWDGPGQAVSADGAEIAAEEGDHLGDVRLVDDETAGHDPADDDGHDPDPEHC